MALTLRTNGSSGVNLITAQWWNDYYNLFTGVMTDQVVTLLTDLLLVATNSGSNAAPTLALAAGTNLSVGLYDYIVTFVDNNGGESSQAQSNVGSITTTTNNQKVSLTAIPTGPTGTVSRNIYRTKVGGGTYFLLTTLNNNTTTTYTDTTADASLGAQNPPANPSFGGTLIIKNPTGVVKGQIFNNGAIYFDGGKITSDGSGDLGVSEALLNGTTTDVASTSQGRILNYTTSNCIIYKTSQTGAAQGHTFGVWTGSALSVPFSVGGQFVAATTWVDNNGDLHCGSELFGIGGYVVFGDKIKADGATILSNGSGTFTATNLGGNYGTNRNGTTTYVPIYTGTNTPASPPTGAIWIKA